MEWFAPVEWDKVFIPDTPILEIVARGSIVYLALFFLLRLVRKGAGQVSLTDLLLLVLLADAAQNAMSAEYHSLTDGLVLVGTLIFWDFLFDWLGFHLPWVEKQIHPPPLALIRNGHLLRKNLQKELISEDELMSRLREKGVDRISQVKEACLEGDGKISVVKKE